MCKQFTYLWNNVIIICILNFLQYFADSKSNNFKIQKKKMTHKIRLDYKFD